MLVWRICNKIIDFIACIFFIIVFLAGLYSVIDCAMVYEHAADESLLRYKPGNGETEEELPPLKNYAGWLSIDNTNIDYPIMQGRDNMEYLNKDPYGNYSLTGSIFLDAENSSDFSDAYNLVYGHHMEGKRMFGQLDSYLDPAFFQKHAAGSLTTRDTSYMIEFITVLETSSDNQTIFSVHETSIEKILAEAGISGSYDHLIALSTCRGSDTPVRTVLIGNLIPIEKDFGS